MQVCELQPQPFRERHGHAFVDEPRGQTQSHRRLRPDGLHRGGDAVALTCIRGSKANALDVVCIEEGGERRMRRRHRRGLPLAHRAQGDELGHRGIERIVRHHAIDQADQSRFFGCREGGGAENGRYANRETALMFRPSTFEDLRDAER